MDTGDVLVAIPKVVILSGTKDAIYEDYRGVYTVKVLPESDFAGSQKVVVKPDEIVSLSQKGKTSVNASVTQENNSFTYLEAIENGNNTTTGIVSTDALTAGSWKGVFDFDVSLVNRTVYTYSQMNTPVANYMNNVTYDPSDYTTSEIANYTPVTVNTANTKPTGLSVSLPAGTLSVTDYNSGITYTKNISAGNYTFYNITPNIGGEFVVKDNNGIVIQEGVLNPTGQVRMINSRAINIRDLGGWSCDGGTIKYGMLYRGAEISDKDIDVLVNQLGIQYELNLRGVTEADRSESPLGEDIDYSVYDHTAIYTISNTDLWAEMLGDLFDAVAAGKPTYFHCYEGVDRTGTFAYIIEALLGVSESDIDKDYELSNFYTGTDTDAHARRRNETQWTGLVAALNTYAGNTLRDKAVSFCLSLGFTYDDINAFRAAMIDGNPEVLTAPVVPAETALYTGNIVSQVGYTDGVRYNSSGTTSSGATATAINKIDFTLHNNGYFKLELSGIDWTSSSTSCRLCLYKNGTFNNVQVPLNTQSDYASYGVSVIPDTTNHTVTVLLYNASSTAYQGANQIAFSGIGSGANAVIEEVFPV